jgi:hypothetical protein
VESHLLILFGGQGARRPCCERAYHRAPGSLIPINLETEAPNEGLNGKEMSSPYPFIRKGFLT